MNLFFKNPWIPLALTIGVLLLPLIKNPYIFRHETLAASTDIIELEEPLSIVNMDLMEALRLRQSTKDFVENQVIPNKELSTILWAANGINRKDGKRTAPSAYGKYYIDIYVADGQGLYRYEPEKHQLKFVSNQNMKSKLASQKFVAGASHVLILTANIKEFPFFVKNEDRIACANATAGCIAENVYLTSKALKLGARLMSSIDKSFIQESLKLNENEIPLFIIPIGFPK